MADQFPAQPPTDEKEWRQRLGRLSGAFNGFSLGYSGGDSARNESEYYPNATRMAQSILRLRALMAELEVLARFRAKTDSAETEELNRLLSE